MASWQPAGFTRATCSRSIFASETRISTGIAKGKGSAGISTRIGSHLPASYLLGADDTDVQANRQNHRSKRFEIRQLFDTIRPGMPLPVKRWSVFAFLFSFRITSTNAVSSVEWQIIKVNGHDYLGVDNISKFYGLPAEVLLSAAQIQSETVGHPFEFVSGSREAMINGARSWLCFPVIEQDGKFLVSRTDVAKTIEPLVRPHRVPNVGKVQTVVLDPGHGGYDKGQVSRYGCEKDFALDVARKLRPILQTKGMRVIMTREGDYFVPLE